MSRSFWTIRPGSERKVHWAPTEASELLCRVVIVCRDCGDLGVRHRNLGVVGRELEELLVLLWTVVPSGQCKDQRVLAL